MMRFLILSTCLGLSAAQVVETMQEYAEIGRKFAEYAATATPTDSEVLRDVLAAGAGGAAGAAGGCPGGCGSAFIETESQEAPIAEVRSDSTDLLKNVKINVAKQQKIPQELISFVEAYEQKRNEQEQSLLEAALHSVPTKSTFLSEKLPFELRIGAGSKRFPSFYRAVRDMENNRRAAEQRIRAELIAMLGKPSTFLQTQSPAKDLAQTIASLQQQVSENPALGEKIVSDLVRSGKPSTFLQTPTLNVQYEFPVSDYAETAKPNQISFAELEKRVAEETPLVAKLAASVKHGQFLMDGSQYDRRTQAPLVWLHLNSASNFLQVPQAITPSIDLYLEQTP